MKVDAKLRKGWLISKETDPPVGRTNIDKTHTTTGPVACWLGYFAGVLCSFFD